MKKTIFVVAALLTLVGAFAVAGYAFAQTPRPNPYPGMGGMMGGSGMMGGNSASGYGHMGGMMGVDGDFGPMHEYMIKALAEKLGLSAEELQTRIENGESMWDIARSQGLSDAEVTALMQDAHNQAIQQAVSAGLITQEQADWMNNHMQQMHGSNGSGGCHDAGEPKNTTGNRTNF